MCVTDPLFSIFYYLWIHPISLGQGLSLEARRAAQAERWSANTATAPASVAAATAAASTTAAAAANEWASPAAAASTTAAAKSGLRQFKALKSIRPVRTGPIKFILFVNIPGLFSVYSGLNRENKFYSNMAVTQYLIKHFGLPLAYAYATLRQSVAGNSKFRGIVFCNLDISSSPWQIL